jgi:DNA primase
MPLFPQQFLDDLRMQADIVQVVQESVSLRRVGGRYTGLCPFHAEKTPSFSVNREDGFFHCFGCGVGGNVFKFVELSERVSFPEAVRIVAQKFGVALPQLETRRDASEEAEREALLKMHEVAAAFYRAALEAASGARARQMLVDRDIAADTIGRLGLGFAPAGRDLLVSQLRKQGFVPAAIVRAGLGVERDGKLLDRFWNRLMIPICRESGIVMAFGGRAMEPDQLPKYLNSSETPIYSKGRALYGLHVTKADIRKQGRVVLVEGYFDFAQALQGGVTNVVATCGTALTQPQAQILRRFAAHAVLSFDPDAAGQGAASRSCELLVREGFQVGVALLPSGQDPDVFVRRHGGMAYQTVVDQARPYLDFLVERTASQYDLATPAGRLSFLNAMLAVAAGIPDAAARDQFADRLAVRAGISEDVVRQEIRKAAVARKPALPERRLTGTGGQVTDAERDLLAQLLGNPEAVVTALADTEPEDLAGLATGRLLAVARDLSRIDPRRLPGVLLERLTEEDVALLTGFAARSTKPSPAADCVQALLRRRHGRVDAGEGTTSEGELNDLLARKLREMQAAQPD